MYRLNVSEAALPLVPTVGRLRSLRYYLVMLGLIGVLWKSPSTILRSIQTSIWKPQ